MKVCPSDVDVCGVSWPWQTPSRRKLGECDEYSFDISMHRVHSPQSLDILNKLHDFRSDSLDPTNEHLLFQEGPLFAYRINRTSSITLDDHYCTAMTNQIVTSRRKYTTIDTEKLKLTKGKDRTPNRLVVVKNPCYATILRCVLQL